MVDAPAGTRCFVDGPIWRSGFYVFRREMSKAFYEYRRMPTKTPKEKSVFARRLRQARLHLDLPQDVLGVLAGLDESSSSARISRYESGIHEPPYQFATALGKVLGVSPAYFYCADDRLAEIIRVYSSLPDDHRDLLYDVAVSMRAP